MGADEHQHHPINAGQAGRGEGTADTERSVGCSGNATHLQRNHLHPLPLSDQALLGN